MRIKQLVSFFRRRQFEEELDEEMRYHIERQVEENIARGMTPDEARCAAMRSFAACSSKYARLTSRRTADAIWCCPACACWTA